MNIKAAILSGGKASRFSGFPKGELLIDANTSIIRHLLNEIVVAGVSKTLIVANDFTLYEKHGVPVIQDMRQDIGPLAGIETALNYYPETDATLFMPCDLPNISSLEINILVAEFLASNAEVIFATTNNGNNEHPLCGVIKNSVLPIVSQALDQGIRKVREMWQILNTQTIDFKNEQTFLNINTVDDLLNF